MPSDKEEINKNIIGTHAIIEAFGGIRPMAQKLNIAASTIQGWKSRNNIPAARLDQIKKVAVHDNINITDNNNADSAIDNNADIVKLSKVVDGAVEMSEKTVFDEKPIILDDESISAEPYSAKLNASNANISEANHNHNNKLAWLAIILLFLLVIAMIARPIWSPITDKIITSYIPNAVNSKKGDNITINKDNIIYDDKFKEITLRIAAFESKIKQLSERLKTISNQPQIIAPTPEVDMTAIMAQINEQINDAVRILNIDDIKASLSDVIANNGGFNDKLSLFDKKLTNMDKRTSRFDVKLKLNAEIQSEMLSKIQATNGKTTFGALLIAISQLEDDILSGQKYNDGIANIRAMAQPHHKLMPKIASSIDILEQYAKDGIATKLELMQKFTKLAPKAQTAYRKANAKDWIDQTFENIKGLISIRKIGDGPGLGPISLAEAALAQDDLPAAIKALEILSDVKIVNQWLTIAKQRLLIINNLSILRKQSIALLTKDKLEITQ